MSSLPTQTVSTPYLGGLARRLASEKVAPEEVIRELQAKSSKVGKTLVALLVEGNHASAARLAEVASAEFGSPMMDLSVIDLEPALLREVGDKLIRKHTALPLFKRGKKLFVAIADPANIGALDEFKFATGLATEAVVVEQDKLAKLVDVEASSAEASPLGVGDSDLDGLEIVEGGEDDPGAEVARTEADDAPIVRYVNKILVDAIQQGASDIHFEPYEKFYRIRYRRDGELKIVNQPPVTQGTRIAARMKVMSRMDLAERRVPQDGRIKLNLSKSKAIDFRVNTCPTLWGEKIVARILDASSAMLGIDVLGYEAEQKAAYMKALEQPQGMILVTGPTGSGKTVSLYTGLNILNTEDVNISTAEDPAEINLPGINQVNVNPKTGLTFAAALKSFLRQDPDVIMVGEIRDLETAEIAIKAAQTGHLVLSTLHTNDAPQTITRLMNMGVPGYNIASTLSLVIAQRLARRLCRHCKKPTDIPRVELLKNGFTEAMLNTPDFTLYAAVGCDQCDKGYKGRTGVYQVMPMTERIGRIIMEGGSAQDIADQAKIEGVKDLRESALKKVMDGHIDLLEANRTTVSE